MYFENQRDVARCCEFVLILYILFIFGKRLHTGYFFAVMGESNIRFGSKIQEKT